MLTVFENSMRFPPCTPISLGTRVNGKLQNESYFILEKAPEVKAVYGDEPEFLEIMFPGDNIDAIAQTTLEYWAAGKKNDAGVSVGGDLICVSETGPLNDGTPGTATWKDRGRLSPPAQEERFVAERDPVTGFIARKCRGPECGDWVAKKCKQTMKIRFIIPRVSLRNLYMITTHSWNSMYEFMATLTWGGKFGGGIAYTPFRIYKGLKSIKHWDAEKGKEYSRAMPILRIKDAQDFMSLYGEEVKAGLRLLKEQRMYLTGAPEPVYLEAPDGEDGGGDCVDIEAPPDPVQRADTILADDEVRVAFALLETALGRELDRKEKQTYVLKKEHAEDIKAAVLFGLNKSYCEILSKKEVEPPPAVTVDYIDPLPVVEQ
jgi:hypothetical protein